MKSGASTRLIAARPPWGAIGQASLMQPLYDFQSMKSGASTRLIVASILMSTWREGPAVSLKGSPTAQGHSRHSMECTNLDSLLVAGVWDSRGGGPVKEVPKHDRHSKRQVSK